MTDEELDAIERRASDPRLDYPGAGMGEHVPALVVEVRRLQAEVADLTAIRCECGWRGVGNHYHDARLGKDAS